MDRNVSVIRGTGFKNLDGTLASVVEERDDGLTSIVPFGTDKTKPILIDSRCVQKVDIDKTFTYEIVVLKSEDDKKESTLESRSIIIPKALRNVTIDTIIEYLNSHLAPILKME